MTATPSSPSTALVVTCHPRPSSLTAALSAETRKRLSQAGQEVLESDLYAMGWDPGMREEHWGADRDPSLPLGEQAALVQARGTMSSDVAAEQDKLRRADLVVFHFPLWWYGMPAVLKGWFDRVFVKGFAYGVKDDNGRTLKYGDGGLAGKRALLVITAGDRATAFGPRGLNGDASELLFPITHGILWYTGMRPLRPHLIAGTDAPGWNGFEDALSGLRERLATLHDEQPLPYRRLADGDYDAERVLEPTIRPNETGVRIHSRSAAQDVS